ncbi:hypothetical protein [Bradyrhizobium sp. 17]|uniref:hypothetical protein n=1 Tax=Bradyrhizobium sp. 17 TaxID=2782649 RepID=UPI001FFA1A29|nr:hypothetical protein [Bradyrhizobium sp. 17]MCK1525027.1 hypothetical protein [Bradyrhizobium sp. 17]
MPLIFRKWVMSAHAIGKPDYIRRTGLLSAHPDRRAFCDDALAWRIRKENGLRWAELDAGELRRREPN